MYRVQTFQLAQYSEVDAYNKHRDHSGTLVALQRHQSPRMSNTEIQKSRSQECSEESRRKKWRSNVCFTNTEMYITSSHYAACVLKYIEVIFAQWYKVSFVSFEVAFESRMTKVKWFNSLGNLHMIWHTWWNEQFQNAKPFDIYFSCRLGSP